MTTKDEKRLQAENPFNHAVFEWGRQAFDGQTSEGMKSAPYAIRRLTDFHDELERDKREYVERDDSGKITKITTKGLDKLIFIRNHNHVDGKEDFPPEVLFGVSKKEYADLLKKSVGPSITGELKDKSYFVNSDLQAINERAKLIGKDLNDAKTFKEITGKTYQQLAEEKLARLRDSSVSEAREKIRTAESLQGEKHPQFTGVVSAIGNFIDFGQTRYYAAFYGQGALLQAFRAARNAEVYSAMLGSPMSAESATGVPRERLSNLTQEFSSVRVRGPNHTDEWVTPLSPALAEAAASEISRAQSTKFSTFGSLSLDNMRGDDVTVNPPETRKPHLWEIARDYLLQK